MTRQRFIATLALLSIGCGGARADKRVAAPDLAPPPAPGRSLATEESEAAPSEHPPPQPTVAMEESADRVSTSMLPGFLQSSGGSSPAPAPPTSLPEPAPAPHEMLDIEARFAIECDKPSTAAAKLRALVRVRAGTITLDEAQSGANESAATFEIRVGSREFEKLAEDLATVGTIRQREVKARDVGKEFHDAQLLLANLESAMRRYEQILAKANTVAEVLPIEHELERLRTRIDRVKGDLAWLQDRVARATVRVRLYPTDTSEEPMLANRSSFYPSLRAMSLFDLRGEDDRYGYAGGGLGFAIHKSGPRAVVLEFDIGRTAFTDRPPDSNYVYVALAGVDLYSDLLGGGRRRFLNPYLGFRGGYANAQTKGDAALGGLVGLDLLKTPNVVVDLSVRGLAMFGSDRGAHVALGPSLVAAFAF
jgi:hypothetical protein